MSNEKINRLLQDLSQLALVLEDCIQKFYDLDFITDEWLIEALGLQFTHRSLLNFIDRYLKGGSVDGSKNEKA